MKSLILKKGDYMYKMIEWNLATNVDKMCQYISGMDTEGMYYQIKISIKNEELRISEYDDVVIIEIFKKK